LVKKGSFVEVVVYDINGTICKKLENGYKSPGMYSITFKSQGLKSGIYYYSIKAGEQSLTKKMMLIK